MFLFYDEKFFETNHSQYLQVQSLEDYVRSFSPFILLANKPIQSISLYRYTHTYIYIHTHTHAHMYISLQANKHRYLKREKEMKINEVVVLSHERRNVEKSID